MAYQSDETGDWEISVQPFPNVDEGRWQISNGGGVLPVWSRTTNELFYIRLPDFRMMAAEFSAGSGFVPGMRRELFDASDYYFTSAGGAGRSFDVSPDEDRFLMLKRPVAAITQIVVVENWFEELKERVPVP